MANKQGKRLNPFQHALMRPDAYIGSCVTIIKEMLVCTADSDEAKENEDDEFVLNIDDEETDKKKLESKFVTRKIKYNPGLFKLFGEAQSNAVDNKWRSEKHGIVMKSIDFTCDGDPNSDWYGYIGVRNDGYCIPVEQAEYQYEDYRTNKTITEMLYPAEVFFGEMLAGTNFEEDEGRKTSGRNGMGAKTDVVFSDHFIIEHTNPEQQSKFYQEYSDHGKSRTKPKITSYSGKTGYTQIWFKPDYAYFSYPGMDEDLLSLCKRYAYESAMITGLAVTFNGEKLLVKGLEKFVRMIYPDVKENCMMSFVSPTGDECVLIEKGVPEMDQLEDVAQHSWINGINTKNGGTHVVAWRDSIFPALVKMFNARKPKKGEKSVLKTTAKEMYPYFTLFVRAEVENPKFDNQPKDCLTVPEIFQLYDEDEKGAKKEFADYIAVKLTKTMKWNFITLLEEKLQAKSDRSQSKKEGVKKKVAFGKKVRDANYAGSSYSQWCTLYITEGDSAKTFADSLIAKMPDGNDYCGSLAIKGKFINAQKASSRELNANEEVIMLKTVLGLRSGAHYDSLDECRYGNVIIFSDEDDDGFHIRGLIICYFYTCFPSLLNLFGGYGRRYLGAFSSLVSYNVKRGQIVDRFYSNPQYQAWYDAQSAKELNGITTKYLKGLGSHKPGDESLYLDDMKVLDFEMTGDEEAYMTLGFDPKQSDWRKEWITRDMVQPGSLRITSDLDENGDGQIQIEGTMTLAKFVDEQLIIYHKMVLERALPHMYDSFKDSQRRIYYGTAQTAGARNGNTMIVNRLGGIIAEKANYHHGEMSLYGTTIGMAQGFVGSNNIPTHKNDGQFGSRLENGKDHAAPRYIATGLEAICDSIFMDLDEPILTKTVENDNNGKPVMMGYEFYMPVICLVLCNGPAGIASGYSTNGANHNPIDVINAQRLWLDQYDQGIRNADMVIPTLVPWYRGFKGEIELLDLTGQKTPKYQTWCGDDSVKPVAWRSKGILKEPAKGSGGYWSIEELPIGLSSNTMKEYLEYLWTGSPPEKSKKKKAERTFITDLQWKGSPNSPKWLFKPAKDFIPDMEVAGNFKILQNTYTLTNLHVIDENGYPRKYVSAVDLLKDFMTVRIKYYSKRKTFWLKSWRHDLNKETSRRKFLIAVREKKIDLSKDEDVIEKVMLAMKLAKIDDSYDYLFDMKIRTMTPKRLAALDKEIEKIQAKISDYENTKESDLMRRDLDNFEKAWGVFLKTRKEE